MPHPAKGRYRSMTEVMRLIDLLGDVRNPLAAFFLGDVGKIAVLMRDSARAPLSAREVAALVARLNALPAAGRFRNSLFGGALPDEIERLLSEPPAWNGHSAFSPRAPGASQPGRSGDLREPANSLPFEGQETPSGYYFPAGPSVTAGTQASELDAARSLLRLDGATVIHVHVSNGKFAVDGRELDPGQFHDQILGPLALPPGQPLILMGCQTAAVAAEMASLTRGLVVGATNDAFTTTTQQILTASTSYDPDGRPLPDPDNPGQWQPAWPDGRPAAALGFDLITGLRNNRRTTHLNITPTHGPLPAPPPTTIRWAHSDPRGIRLDGAFISVADTVRTELDPWLRERLRVPGVFDLALTDIDGALGTVRDGSPDEPLGTGELARRLPEWGATDGNAIRLVTPGGIRFADMMAELADLRQRPVLLTPLGASLSHTAMSWDDQEGADIIPVGLSGEIAPWQVTWPQDSWEYQHGNRIVAAGMPFGDAFVVGLHAGPGGLMLFYNGEGGGFAIGSAEPDYLRDLGWDDRQTIVLVTRRWPEDGVSARLRDLSDWLQVSVHYSLPQGFASIDASAILDRLHLLQPELGLFDLLLERDERDELVVPLDLPELSRELSEVRVVGPDGEPMHDTAADLALELERPVWVRPDGATVRVDESGRLVATDRETGAPAAWEQVLPGPVVHASPPWYDTSSGIFRPRPGDAIIEYLREPSGDVAGIVLAHQTDYNYYRTEPQGLPPVGLYLVNVDIDRDLPRFQRHRFDGSMTSRPFRELPRLLEAHGWTRDQHIVIYTNFSDFNNEADEAQNQRWDAITEAFAGVARDEGVTVFFPERGSIAQVYGDNDIAVTSGVDPRWDRRDPPARPARFGQDPVGRLRELSEGDFFSLTLSGSRTVDGVRLRRGAASPTEDMMRVRSQAYHAGVRDARDLRVFVADVPLTDTGNLGLVFADARGAEPGWRVAAATAAQVLDLIMGSGYRQESQALQILTAPETQAQYDIFQRDAQQVADQLGRGVYIVGSAGATVLYHEARHAFAARGGGGHGDAIEWRLVWPGANGDHAALPLYFETDGDGVLVRSASGRGLRTFGNLITFEPANRVGGERDRYNRYASNSGGLAAVVVPTRGGRPVDSAGVPLPAQAVADAVMELARLRRGALTASGWEQEQLDDSRGPVRLLARPLDNVQLGSGLHQWAESLAQRIGATVFLAEGERFNAHFGDYTAGAWRSFEPGAPDTFPAAPLQVVDEVTGLVVPEDLGANPLRGADGAGIGSLAASPSDLVVEQSGRRLVLPGPGETAWSADQVQDDEFVVVAHGGAGNTVMGMVRGPGGRKAGMVPVPPEWLAELIRAADGYTPGTRVILLVPGLGLPWPEAPAPEHYVQQIADLLQAPVEAIVSVTADRSLSVGRAVFRPWPPTLRFETDNTGGVRLLSLPPSAQRYADAMVTPAGTQEVQVFLLAFSDGSLGLHYPPQRRGQQQVYSISPRMIAAALAPVLAGRPFAIRPVTAPDMEVSQHRLAATVAAIQAHLDRLAPPPYHDFEVDDAEWQRANRWWSAELSGARTGRDGLYRPTPAQRRYLDEHQLQVRWVEANGDCSFIAVTFMVPQADVRRRMLQAAQRVGIQVPLGEPDGVAWLLRQAVDRARTELSPEVISELVEVAAPVTGQHLRLFLAYLMEHDPVGFRPDFFASDDAADIYEGYEDTWTNTGLVEATRRLEASESHTAPTSEVAAHYLDLPLQVLAGNGIPHSCGRAAPRWPAAPEMLPGTNPLLTVPSPGTRSSQRPWIVIRSWPCGRRRDQRAGLGCSWLTPPGGCRMSWLKRTGGSSGLLSRTTLKLWRSSLTIPVASTTASMTKGSAAACCSRSGRFSTLPTGGMAAWTRTGTSGCTSWSFQVQACCPDGTDRTAKPWNSVSASRSPLRCLPIPFSATPWW